MKKEIPYCCEVRIDSYREPRPRDAKKLVRMAATILVDRESQKPIVIGRGGQMIKAVGIHARKKLEEFLKNQVHLDLSVKVEKDWRRSEKKLKALGYLN
mmetsp:Transcript_24687/g.57532  ORF Transcript_24687/g.57532 Transcript_24687/m.57532 type:complete len:99 (+) Transcript_24687:1073-1369(+)